MADSSRTKEYYTGLKKRTLLILEMVSGEDRAGEIEKLENTLLKLLPPVNYAGATGAEVEMIKAYERACAVMRQHQSKDPKRMTVLEFYETLESLKTDKKKYQLNGQPD